MSSNGSSSEPGAEPSSSTNNSQQRKDSGSPPRKLAKTILNEIDIRVDSGHIYGLLGPNGAGKTTTFYIIAGLIGFESGEINFLNQDISKPVKIQCHQP